MPESDILGGEGGDQRRTSITTRIKTDLETRAEIIVAEIREEHPSQQGLRLDNT